MIGLVVGVVISAALFAWAGYYLFGQIANRGSLPMLVRLGLALAAAIGLMLTALNMRQLAVAFARQAWPTVTGVVTDAKVLDEFDTWHIQGQELIRTPLPASPERDDKVKRYERLNLRPQISFRWELAGQDYQETTDLGVPGFGGRLNRRDLALKLLATHAPGSEVNVHYNPDDPAEGYLRAGPHWEQFGRLALGVLLLGIGSGGLLVRREEAGGPVEEPARA